MPSRKAEQRQAAKKGAVVNKARAATYAANVLPVIEQIRAGGASLRQIAAELNARGVKTARGGKWHATTIRNILTIGNAAVAQVARNGGFDHDRSVTLGALCDLHAGGPIRIPAIRGALWITVSSAMHESAIYQNLRQNLAGPAKKHGHFV